MTAPEVRPLRSDWDHIEREIGYRLDRIREVRPDPQPAPEDDPYYAKYRDEAIVLADQSIAVMVKRAETDPATAARADRERPAEERRIAELRAAMTGENLYDDIAMFVLSFRRRPRRPEFGAQEVTDFLPPTRAADLAAAQAAAIALVNAAAGYGDRMLARDSTVPAQMTAEHPQFSQGVLSAVLNYGCYVMR